MYVEFKRNLQSKKQILQNLYIKGIQKDLIAKALDDCDFSNSESIQNIIKKRIYKYDLTNKKDLQKLYMYLLGKGYNYNEVHSALKEVMDFE